MSKEATQAQHAKQRLLAGKTNAVQRVRAGQAPGLSCNALGVQRACCTGNCSQGRSCPTAQPQPQGLMRMVAGGGA